MLALHARPREGTCGVEFRVASDDQFGQLVAAIREHARSSHGHELTTQQVLAEVMA